MSSKQGGTLEKCTVIAKQVIEELERGKSETDVKKLIMIMKKNFYEQYAEEQAEQAARGEDVGCIFSPRPFENLGMPGHDRLLMSAKNKIAASHLFHEWAL